ncbi:MAG: hypothetical protein OEV51_08150 [Nitrospira sp.]|nr:hypothetical protein [Nitrospira sp.]
MPSMNVVDTLTQYAVQYGLQAAVALGILVAGMMASRGAGNVAQQALEKQTLASLSVNSWCASPKSW